MAPAPRAFILLLPLLLTACNRTAQTASSPPPAEEKRVAVYDENADARADIAAACKEARQSNRHVMVMYGGNWCGWCIRLTRLLETDPDLSKAMRDHYVLVHVDINSNKPLAAEYGVEEGKGVPYLTILNPDNKVIRNQETGVLEQGSGYDLAKVMAVLNECRPGARAAR